MKKILFYTLVAVVFLVQLRLVVWSPKVDHSIKIRPVLFSQLPGFNAVHAKQSLAAFHLSCHTFLKQDPEQMVGSQYIPLKAKDWAPVCRAAQSVDGSSETEVRAFFKTWFSPVEFYDGKPVTGLFTGYYIPLLHGNLTKTPYYSVPLYTLPTNLVTATATNFPKELAHHNLVGRVVGQRLVPFYTRAEIDKGAVASTTEILAFVHHPLDRLILEIEGSGVVGLTNGQMQVVGYAGVNGAPYQSIPSIFIKKGIMNPDNASMTNIRTYLDKHPKQIKSIFNQNKSFVFFRNLPHNQVVGSQGIPLTPGYSIAVDRKWIPMGVPVWLETQFNFPQKAFKRLMIAQDTGGAIQGPVRGDVYWGFGEEATKMANQMKSPGHYWLLLPRQIAV